MNLHEEFNNYWREQFTTLQPKNCNLVLAVSGGVDSVVMVDLVFNAGFSFSIAHCNFQLRGEESERDEGFVRSLGEKYGVDVLARRFETTQHAAQQKTGIQETARDLRYEWFNELLANGGSVNKVLLTAHHADDNVETVLFNIFRGTGVSGLHGILPKQGNIIRPLLFASRANILAYAKQRKLDWVEDSSNESSRYSRNYIRHEVLPILKQIFPAITENIRNSIDRWREGEELYRQAIEMHKTKLCEARKSEVHIPVLKLQKVSPLKTIVFEIIKDFGFSSLQTEEVIALLDSESGKYVASHSHRVVRNRNWLIITPNKTEGAENILIEEHDNKIRFPEGEVTIEHIEILQPSTSVLVATIDAKQVRFPLLLRRWKPGDYFYPLGMRKKKKLSRFLIDQKISLPDKERTWVIESNKKIVWVVGHRIDDRFKLTPATKQVLRLSFRNR